MQEGFFQIPFPHFPSVASSYSTLARYQNKNCRPENPPHSLIITAFVLASVTVLLLSSEGTQTSTQNSGLKFIHHSCAVAYDQAGNAGLVPCNKPLASETETSFNSFWLLARKPVFRFVLHALTFMLHIH